MLRGEAADSIPTSSPDLNVDQVDWRQLRRWGISEARVPAGTLVRFREPSVWDRYRLYILGAAAVLLAQTVLIVGLLVQGSDAGGGAVVEAGSCARVTSESATSADGC